MSKKLFRISGLGSYRMRNGERFEVRKHRPGYSYPWAGSGVEVGFSTRRDDGRMHSDGSETPYDLIAPWFAPKKRSARRAKAAKPSLEPQRVDGDCWYYETRSGIEIYTPEGAISVIPWRMLEASRKRCCSIRRLPRKGKA